PLFNESAKETPAAIKEMSDAIEAADAVVIACPETDHSVPSSLKSIIEWLSYQLHPFTNKPVLLVGASTDAQGSSR
ncbi:NAD(P)H-dependent oxidoreductase, partial [Roseburia faecis]|nr:NAD(P)H-dependent oxidoreductase [Roseburia faecis]